MVVSAIGSFLGTLIHTNEKNWDGSIRLFYRFRVAIDITKSLKKQMKLKKNNGTWAVIDFRYERLPTFCFLCGVIGHGDRYCPKFVNGYDCNLEKPFGARMRAGSRHTAPTSGQRWVAPETDVDRASWKSPAMEAVESEAVSETFAKGKEPMVTATGNGVAGVPSSNSRHADIPTVARCRNLELPLPVLAAAMLETEEMDTAIAEARCFVAAGGRAKDAVVGRTVIVDERGCQLRSLQAAGWRKTQDREGRGRAAAWSKEEDTKIQGGDGRKW
nr:uncharacterized protein LOC109174453 [Ipomoea trifida]